MKSPWLNNLFGIAVISLFTVLVAVSYNKHGWEVAVNFGLLYLLFIMSLESKSVPQIPVNVPQNSEGLLDTLLEPVTLLNVNDVEFETTPLSFQQERMLEMIKNSEFGNAAEAYVMKLNFITARVKDKSLVVKNLPSSLIPKLIDKASKQAKTEEITEFDNIENLFENES